MIRAKRLVSLPPLEPALYEAVEETLAGLGFGRPSVIGAWAGGQSVCYELYSQGDRFVLKVLSTAHSLNTDDTATAEFDALAQFGRFLTGSEGVVAPRALALYESHRALLMTHVEGRDFDAWMGRLLVPGTTLSTLSTTIVRALRLYHDAVGREFGDFHPGNVLVREADSIVLIDPTSPDALIATMATEGISPMALDIGYWASAVALNWPLEARTVARHPFNRLRITRHLISVAGRDCLPVDQQTLRASVSVVAQAHIRRLQDRGSSKEKLLALVALGTLRSVGITVNA